MIEFITPFIIPLGLFVLPATIDSIFVYGQILDMKHLDEYEGGRRLKRILAHYSKFAHHYYFACFGYDISALVTLATTINQLDTIPASYPNLIVTISAGIIFHILAYFHSFYIFNRFIHSNEKNAVDKIQEMNVNPNRKEEEKKWQPMTYLNLFYTVLSTSIIVAIRWFETSSGY